MSADMGPLPRPAYEAGWVGVLGPDTYTAEQMLAYARQESESLRKYAEIFRAERDHARAQFHNAARLISGIHMLLYPKPIKLDDGRTMVFRPENPHEFMQVLSDKIRALPDELAAMQAKEQG